MYFHIKNILWNFQTLCHWVEWQNYYSILICKTSTFNPHLLYEDLQSSYPYTTGFLLTLETSTICTFIWPLALTALYGTEGPFRWARCIAFIWRSMPTRTILIGRINIFFESGTLINFQINWEGLLLRGEPALWGPIVVWLISKKFHAK